MGRMHRDDCRVASVEGVRESSTSVKWMATVGRVECVNEG